MEKAIFVLGMVLLFEVCSAVNVYYTSFDVCLNGTVFFDEISAIDGIESQFPSTDSGYYVKVRSSEGRLLSKRNIVPSFYYTVEPPLQAGVECCNVQIAIPVCSGGRSIEICKGDTVLYNIDLSQLCNADGVCDEWEYREMCPDDCLCGNSVCGQDEDSSSCPSDCAEGCDYDGVCDEWETEECEDCSKEDDAGIPIYMFALPLLVFGIIGFLLLRKKSGGRPVPNMAVPGGY